MSKPTRFLAVTLLASASTGTGVNQLTKNPEAAFSIALAVFCILFAIQIGQEVANGK